MERKRKRRNIVLTLVLVALAAGMIALPTLLRSAKPETEDKASILSARVERSQVRTTISGGGTLTDQDGVAVTVPKGVEVMEYLVSNGDWVEKGQPVVAVDKISVMQTIITVQENLDYLAKQLRRNPGRVSTDAIFAPVAGRVKAVYAQKGDAASDVMERFGCLAVVSLDGLMALETETEESADPGDPVTVELADGTRKPGRIDQRRGNKLVVTLSDDGPEPGTLASVFSADDKELGSGELYVHSAWNVTAASGTITYVAAAVNKTVGAGGHLFNLDNVDFTSKFRDLSAQHRDDEKAIERHPRAFRRTDQRRGQGAGGPDARRHPGVPAGAARRGGKRSDARAGSQQRLSRLLHHQKRHDGGRALRRRHLHGQQGTGEGHLLDRLSQHRLRQVRFLGNDGLFRRHRL